jgi:hypothetical protein
VSAKLHAATSLPNFAYEKEPLGPFKYPIVSADLFRENSIVSPVIELVSERVSELNNQSKRVRHRSSEQWYSNARPYERAQVFRLYSMRDHIQQLESKQPAFVCTAITRPTAIPEVFLR